MRLAPSTSSCGIRLHCLHCVPSVVFDAALEALGDRLGGAQSSGFCVPDNFDELEKMIHMFEADISWEDGTGGDCLGVGGSTGGDCNFGGGGKDFERDPAEQHGTWDAEGNWLDPKELTAARKLEYKWIEQQGVIQAIPWREAEARMKGQRPFGLRWVDKAKTFEDGRRGGHFLDDES